MIESTKSEWGFPKLPRCTRLLERRFTGKSYRDKQPI